MPFPPSLQDTGEWTLAPHFVLRAPLMPLSEYVQWSGTPSAPLVAGSDGPLFEEAVERDARALRDGLMAIARRPQVREALFLASSGLESALPVWFERPDSDRGRKVERAVVRYFARMTSRSTPFGLFAGCSVGRFDGTSELSFTGSARCRRVTRLDMDYILALCEQLAESPLKGELLYYPNSSLYLAGDRWRYVEAKLTGRLRSYQLVALDATEPLGRVLRRAATGALLAELCDLLADDPEIDRDQAQGFVDELVAAQVLVPEIFPSVTDPHPVAALSRRLRALHDGAAVAAQLDGAMGALEQLDRPPLGVEPGRYRAIADGLPPVAHKFEPSRLFQVDVLRTTTRASLGPDVARELVEAVRLLSVFAEVERSSDLTSFAAAFEERFGSREVPLVEALDDDLGVGFASGQVDGGAHAPLLRGIPLDDANAGSATPWRPRDRFLLRQLTEAVRSGAREIAIGDDALRELAPRDPAPLPDALALVATLAAESPKSLARGDFRLVLEYLWGPSGARLLGRFCHLDPTLHELVQSHLRVEEALNPTALFAEVVHVPQGRLGNVVVRPVLRRYEIPYLCRAEVDRDHQIPISDLLVSLRGARVVLRSRRLGCEIVPRVTHAHNFQSQGNLPAYRFLGALQQQAVCTYGVRWSWGPLEGAEFLPRVVRGPFVLARASWLLTAAELEIARTADRAKSYKAVCDLRRARGVPRWISIADDDHVLPFDLDNVLSVETFVQLTRSDSSVRIDELLPGPGECCATGPDGTYRHELVALLVRKPRPDAPSAASSPGPARASAGRSIAAPPPRTFLPGSEWLYAKLYAGKLAADQVLREVVAPVVEESLADGSVDQFFFLRYADPEWHVRVRFHGDASRLVREVLPLLERRAAPLQARGVIARMQLDTYERELERYGGVAIGLAERVFHADSLAALSLISDPAAAGADVRWRAALLGADCLLGDLGFDTARRWALVKEWRAAMATRLNVAAAHDPKFGARFREERRFFDAPGQTIDSLLSHFARRSKTLEPIARDLRALECNRALAVPLATLAGSYVHMHINRLIAALTTRHELVIYDFLDRFYESRIARAQHRRGTHPAEV